MALSQMKLVFGALLFSAGVACAAGMPILDTAQIEKATGLKGSLDQKSGVFKVSQPRKDIVVKVEGKILPPFMGLGAWAAFEAMPNGQTMVMGDNCLLEDEVNPVIDVAIKNGLQITALHNHFFFEEPKIYFMHISGMGSVEHLAKAVAQVYQTVKTLRAASPEPAKSFPGATFAEPSSITAPVLEGLLGVKGQAQDGMFKVVFGREVEVDGVSMGAAMGVNTWAAFIGTDAHAVVDGDFAMAAGEMQAVIKALRKGGINVVAIHSHMSDEQPRIFFLHFWGKGEATALAQTLKAALDAQKASNHGSEKEMHGERG